MTLAIHHIDAFTDQPFSGNPAAVCLTNADLPDAFMQSVAAELNLSETAFLRREDGAFALRWFTPVSEVDLCGHATLASAHALWEQGVLDPTARAVFRTRSGTLTCTRRDQMIEMDFPSEAARRSEAPAGLIEALSTEPVFVGKNRLDFLVEVASETVVRGLTPDFGRLTALDARGVMVTAQADPASDYDFVSRYFAPAFGIPEDPVTGSAHCCLGPYWHARIGGGSMVAYQASPRGGTVYVEVVEDRVILGGTAVTIMRSELLVEGK